MAAVVYNNSPGPTRGDVDPATTRIPIVGITGADGIVLAGLAGAQVTVEARDHFERTVSHNLLAQTRTGRTDNVVLAGAHLDSVPNSPRHERERLRRLRAAGDGAAARQLAQDQERRAVRLVGRDLGKRRIDDYLSSLTFDQQLDIAMYVAVEAIGSSNGGYFVYDGDNSGGLVGPMPFGSAQIERAFVNYFAGRGIEADGTHIGQARGEYSHFIAAGIPTGGPYTGIQFIKTEAQAAKWGGTAGIAYHPCHDAACDNLGSINREILDRNADALAFVTATYALSTEDVNGVPAAVATSCGSRRREPVGFHSQRGENGMKRTHMAVAIAAIAVTVAPVTAAYAAPGAHSRLAEQLTREVTIDGVHRHLIALQRFADRNGGNRADPGRGYQETRAYVENTMRAAGFDVDVQEFTYDRVVIDRAVVAAGATSVNSNPMTGAPDTPAGGITGPLVVVPVDADSGCQATDYAGLNPTGAVVLVRVVDARTRRSRSSRRTWAPSLWWCSTTLLVRWRGRHRPCAHPNPGHHDRLGGWCQAEWAGRYPDGTFEVRRTPSRPCRTT